MKALGKAYKDAEASSGGDFERIPAGGYVVRITSVTDLPSKEYLDVVFDIAEGDKKGFFSDQWSQEHPYAHHFVMSYKETALGMFKGRLRAIDESNNTGFEAMAATGLQEQALVGKIVGVVIGYEEYISNQGEIRQRSYVRQVIPAARIRSGDFKVPEVKPIERDASSGPATAAEPPAGFQWADTPFA